MKRILLVGEREYCYLIWSILSVYPKIAPIVCWYVRNRWEYDPLSGPLGMFFDTEPELIFIQYQIVTSNEVESNWFKIWKDVVNAANIDQRVLRFGWARIGDTLWVRDGNIVREKISEEIPRDYIRLPVSLSDLQQFLPT